MTRIAVFGSAGPKPGDNLYEESRQLGKLLAEAGFDVITGGYMGTMAAVSQGAVEAGGHTIGVTCKEIESWRPVGANEWIREEWPAETLIDRLKLITHACDAALALPGGIGTLVEISLTWNQIVVQSYKPKPLIAIGPGWQKTFQAFYEHLGEYTLNSYRQWLAFAQNNQEALLLLKNKLRELR